MERFHVLVVLSLLPLACFSDLCLNKKQAVDKHLASYLEHALLASDTNFAFCMNCSQEYLGLTQAFDQLKDDSDPNCLNRYVGTNRLNMFWNMYQQAVGWWDNAKCASCYSFWNATPGAIQVLSNDTKTFFNLTEQLNNCTKGAEPRKDNHTICERCEGEYMSLNSLYEEISTRVGKLNICFDIVNSMNKTRRMWSGELGCCRDNTSSPLKFIISAVFVGSITVFFYIAAFVFSKKAESSSGFLANSERPSASGVEAPTRTAQVQQSGTSGEEAPFNNLVAITPEGQVAPGRQAASGSQKSSGGEVASGSQKASESKATSGGQRLKKTNIEAARDRENLINLDSEPPQPAVTFLE